MMGDSDTLARFTGLTLDPERPPSHQTPADYVEEQIDEDAAADGDDLAVADGGNILTLRSLVSTKEAGVVIGKGGQNVAEVRELTGVKAGVSKVIQGVHERILTVAGPLESVAKAYSLIAKNLLANQTSGPQHQPQHPDSITLRLLVSHQLMGSIIGKGGAKIKDIQEASGAKIVISKEMLPQSTERVIDVFGIIDSIQIAVHQIGECILNDIERAVGTIVYNPQVRLGGGVGGRRDGDAGGRTGGGDRRSYGADGSNGNGAQGTKRFGKDGRPPSAGDNQSGELQTQTLSIPADMVGCIIGKGGNFINHIRKVSQCRISISKETDTTTNERTFTISGTPEANEKALHLLYTQLENEKQRRLASGPSAE
ncbi:hypothetical protein BJ742DRAFT_805781 [Cladochytrium replicatum]|nr:hypothetical protein BJ742DRAFT_805781 [Cladochytrium replicatum]